MKNRRSRGRSRAPASPSSGTAKQPDKSSSSKKQSRRTARPFGAGGQPGKSSGSNPSRSPQNKRPIAKQRPKPGPELRKVHGDPALERQILALLAQEPLDATTIGNRLQLAGPARRNLKDLLREWEHEGRIARIRHDRYILPEEADLFTGEIQFHPNGAAHVLNPEKGGADLFISPEDTATALHGDKVVARVMNQSPGFTGRRQGRVIRILERKNNRIVGTLQRSKNFFYVVADDPRFVNNLYVPEPDPSLHAKAGDKVVARLDQWTSRHINPEGEVVERIGRAGDPGVDILSIIRKYHLPEEFPPEVLKEAARIGKQDPSEEAAADLKKSRRLDCRADFIFTIDPDDARDFDDAIFVERTASGWRVGIHIADVSHYVQPGSTLDREAAMRGNSVYLPDRVIPMLPEVLSNGLCSLRPHEDRLAFSVFADIARDGSVRRTSFAKTVICSRHRLTYRQALQILENPPSNELESQVHMAWEVSSLLRRRRFERGSLDLDFPEIKVVVDERGKPVRLEKVENDISHQLIEELMLLANESVARESTRSRQPTIYRIHENPDPEKLLEYRELALSLGARCGDLTNRSELQKLLRAVRGESYEYTVKVGLLKSLKRAQYSEEPLGHYGLAKSDYLHFTSPIRRYSDLVAHRALEKRLGLTQRGPDSRKLPEIAAHISGTERNAADAEREAVKLKKLEFFQIQIEDRKGDVFPARILEVRNFGMFVELPDFMVSGLVHVSTLDDDFYLFDPARSCFTGRKFKRKYQAGEEIEVMVSRVDLFKQQIDFRPAPPAPTTSKPKISSSSKRKKSR